MSTGPLDPESRDAALQKLRDWRLTIALGSAGAVVAFATVAAVTIPGKDGSSTSSGSGGSGSPSVPDNTGSNGGDQAQPTAPSDNGGELFQQPPQNPGFGVGGGGQAVSGGSR
jgi:hypothetical protein